MSSAEPVIERITTSAFIVPTDAPEADGTLAWNATTLVVVRAASAGVNSLGYTYADLATASLIDTVLGDAVLGRPVSALPACYHAMQRAVRNLGRDGVAAMGISAVDTALWDLKARLSGTSLADLLGRARDSVPIYGSGGFTSYGTERLQRQLSGWVEQGISRVKIKIGAEPKDDTERVKQAREAVGARSELFVDANGAYDRKQALAFAETFAALGVSWFEEPVPSDDLAGLSLLVARGPAGLEIAAGEYGYQPRYFERMLAAGAVDVLQADATRCGGVTGFMQVAALCEAHGLPLSCHCAPALHAHLGCAAERVRHVEYFHDHVRIESLLFDGALEPRDGSLKPELARPGFGLELRESEARRYSAAGAVRKARS
jgi:L-alanine-DL-glutamate epimerase-like enolase superfamily enzyme